jgi:Ca2+-binding RTX toxin-like protein
LFVFGFVEIYSYVFWSKKMSQTLLTQWNSFLDKLLDPSLVDQLGGDLEAAKEYVKSWANVNLKPLVTAEALEAGTLRASAADQAAEASALRQRISTFEPSNPVAQNVKRVMEIIADTKEAGVARLEQLASQADVRALSNAERYGAALDMAKQLGAIAGLLDIGLKVGEASSTNKWEPVGEVSVGVLAGLGAGLAIGSLVAGMPVLVGLGVAITVGYVATKAGEAFVWPFIQTLSKWIPNSFWDKYFSVIESIVDATNTHFLGARNVVIRSDPLVLDLDGDGLELLGASGNILFDHNADGIKTGTGWARPDDGFLVRDLDGNGVIDTGRELFGVDTLKSNGSLATQGFDALKDLDSNNDGFITSADAAFGELKVWQDINQDGITQSGEIKTLTQLNITSIGANGNISGPQVGQVINNNLVALSATYTLDGRTRTVGAIDLEANNFFTEFPPEVVDEVGNPITFTTQALALPQMNGSGMVRNMRAAASLSSGFADALQTFAGTTTRDGQRGQLDGLITQWAGTTTYTGGLLSGGAANITFTLPAGMTATQYSNIINVLEAFNGSRFYGNELGGPRPSGFAITSSIEPGTENAVYHYYVSPLGEQVTLLQQAYGALKESVYAALVVQTRLKSYLDRIELSISEAEISFDTTGLTAALISRRATDERNALIDLVELHQYTAGTLSSMGFGGIPMLRSWIDALAVDSPLRSELASLNVYSSLATSGSSRSDIYLGDASENTFNAGASDDWLDGGAGNDLLQGGAGNDVLEGGAGNDILAGGVYDTWNGNYNGAGRDTYMFGLGDGQDTIADNDTTAGVVDRIVFKSGILPASVLISRSGDSLVLKIQGTSDQITVNGYFSGDGAGGWAIEQIQFVDDPATVWDIASVKAKALLGTVSNDTLQGYATDDTINAGEGNDTVTGNDGNDILNGEAGTDSLGGGNGNDVLEGGTGADSLIGGNGNDTLNGGADGDILQGGAGDDVLDGGAGNDVLGGGAYDTWNGNYDGAGSDTYLFGLGDGQDTVVDNDTTAGVIDKIVFKAGILPASVLISRSGDSLILAIQGTSDQVTVNGYFNGDGAGGWAIEEIRFADDLNTVWTVTDVKNMALVGSAGSDALTGYATDDVIVGNDGNDTISGRAGNDTLYGGNGGDSLSGEDGNDLILGEAGADSLSGGNGVDTLWGGADNDTLQGGAGDDILEGGAGNDLLGGGVYDTWNGNYNGAGSDIYMFGLGDGQDTIADNDTTAGVVDKIVFKAGILPGSVLISRSGDSLVLKIQGTSDQVTVNGYFNGDGTGGWAVEEIRFADDLNTVWTVSDVKTMALVGRAGSDALTGYATDDVIVGNDGNDTISARAGNDTLYGGNGADTLSGEDGDDLLLGEAGGDSLSGGNGNDTLSGGADGDTLQGGSGNDILDGGAGNDLLGGGVYDTWNGVYTGTGSDTYLFGRGDGQDTIADNDTTAGVIDKIIFKAGVLPADILVSRSGDTLVLKIIGTSDQISVSGYFNGDGAGGWAIEEIRFTDDVNAVWSVANVKNMAALVGGAGNDTLIGYATDDVMAGNDGNDTMSGRAGNDTLYGGNGADILNGEDGNDLLLGEAGGDSLNGGNGNDTLNGGADVDTLQGGSGNDTLDGGTGNDILAGGVYDTWNGVYTGTGSDTYLFGRGDGQDTISDNDGTAGVIDKIIFKAGVLPGDVLVSRSGDILVLKITGTTDQISVSGYFNGDGAGGWAIEEIRFTDDANAVWSVANVKSMALVGTAGNDTLTGYATDDVLVGNDGNDTISARAGNDTLYGGNGADTLSGEDGNDVLLGEAGGDSLSGGNGNDTLNGGADVDTLQGGAGNDILDGGTGNDILAGAVYDTWNGVYTGTGSDTYLFGLGDGQDTIYDNDGTAGVVDKIIFKAGILPGSVLVSRSGDSLVLKIQGTTDQITVNGYFSGDGAGGWAVEEIRFTDDVNAVWSVANVKLMALTGGSGNDTLTGYASDDVLVGNDGNDTISARAGNDTLYGGNGADTLSGEDGNDTLLGEAGGDSLSGGNGNDTLNGGADGDTLQGGAGNDILVGGSGNDILAGGVYDTWNGVYTGTGNDIYRFGVGGGQDTIYDDDGTAGNIDRIEFDAGIAPSGITVTRSGNNLVLRITGTADTLTVGNYLANNSVTTWSIEEIAFGDGTVWKPADIDAILLNGGVVGTATTGADSLIGNNTSADTLNGLAGNDILRGLGGNDTLTGGTGNDQLFGGSGADTYLFARGDGADVLTDADATAGVADTLRFDASVAADQLWFQQVGLNLEVSVIGTTDKSCCHQLVPGHRQPCGNI